MANDTNIKIMSFSPGSGLAVAGTADFANTILSDMPGHLEQAMAQPLFEKMGRNVLTEATILRAVAKKSYDDWFGQAPAPARPPLVFLLCGYAQDKPHLISLMSHFDFAPGRSNTGFQTIGVNMLAIYLLNRLYNRNLTASAAARLAFYVISETISQDGKVGGPIKIGIVKPNCELRLLTESEVAEIHDKTVEYSDVLRNHFLKVD
jgi:hypothetical protein